MEEMEYLGELTSQYPILEAVKDDMLAACEALWDCYTDDGKLMIARNGGGCVGNERVVGELMEGFVKRRSVSNGFAAALQETDEKRGEELASCLRGGLPAIVLTGHAGLATAFLDDVNGEVIYAQQLYGYRKEGDVFTGISTSGNAENVMYAVAVAKASGIKTIGLIGKNGGKMTGACDCSIMMPFGETLRIQELHLLTHHTLCLMPEEHFYEIWACICRMRL